MDCSGLTHGPPLPVQPGPALSVISSPSRSASSTACLNSSHHWSLMNSTGPRGMPTSTSMMIIAADARRFIASRSAVMPSRLRLPSMMNQYTHGRAASGGSRTIVPDSAT